MATIQFQYVTQDGGNGQSGTYDVDSDSSLYGLEVKDTFPLHYDPKNPERFHSGEYSTPFRRIGLVAIVIFFALVGCVIFFTGQGR